MASRRTDALVLVIPVLGVLSGWMVVIASSDRSLPSTAEEVPWVRSVDGWERATWLVEMPAPFTPPVHPAVVAVGLFSAAAIVFGASEVLGKKLDSVAITAIAITRDDRL